MSQVKQDHPLNLSILISGGKEINQDSPSNCERTGKSPGLKDCFLSSPLWPTAVGFSFHAPKSFVETYAIEGESPVIGLEDFSPTARE